VRQHDVRTLGADDTEPEVHRVDHVGRVLTLRDDLDGAAEPLDGRHEVDPLRHGAPRVGLVVEIHVGVDRIVDPEVVRADHHVAAPPAQLGAVGHGVTSDRLIV